MDYEARGGERLNGIFLGKALRKHYIAFVLTLLVCIGSAVLVNQLVEPAYQAEASLVANIGPTANSGTYNEFLASQMLTKTYEKAIQSRYIADEVVRKLNLEQSAYELLKTINVRTDPGTLVIMLYAKSDDPKRAVEVANAFADSFITNSKKIVQNANVTLLDRASLQQASIPVSPKKTFNLALSVLIGLFAGLSMAVALEKREQSRRKARLHNIGVELSGMSA
ncbi:YveK family protein [Paenibacillus pinistramenti]|uniref:YveK family protein n=1 Tax=Paenibacillus pinistramenti TaxID=1768003 RepID=UPI00110844E6|nr:GNVR domain-containing protein [Paenibacillus pinistramenti]